LRQILINLLDNAVKYGPEGQEVRVRVALHDGSLQLEVEDEGPGVPERERERIWERFYRIEDHRRSAVSGTGIGLSVVRELAALHHGEAWAEAGARGGARFVVRLPALTATA
ncbi:MAG: ATP-binding protein, partial [Thermoanaerobaculia bacterium]